MKPDLWHDIYVAYYHELYLYSYALCQDSEQAQELVSETFYKAMLSFDHHADHLKYWLFRVAKNLWLDWLKKSPVLPLADPLPAQGFSGDPVLNTLLLHEQHQLLYQGILRLPSPYKETVTLYYFCHLSLNEIAQTLGVSAGSARTTLYRARQKLKFFLTEVECYEL